MAKRKKKEPEPKAEINKDMDPGHGLEILKLSDIIPDGRPLDISDAASPEGRRYTLVHPGSLSLYQTVVVTKLRDSWGVLWRKWQANECTEKECDELDEVACHLIALISDVPEETAKSWTWRVRMQIVTLHFGYLVELFPNLRGAALPNRAVRRALAAKQKGGVSDGS